MTALIGLAGAILGALLGSVATYLTTRSNMWLTLKHSYDQVLQGKRLEHYQALFHLTKCLPRYWPRGGEPGRKDLPQYMQDFHDWYFGEEAGGMFLTPAAKDSYMKLLSLLAEVAFTSSDDPGSSTVDNRLSASESQALRKLASELRHQLAEDVGAANPPGLRWVRPTPQPPPPNVQAQSLAD